MKALKRGISLMIRQYTTAQTSLDAPRTRASKYSNGDNIKLNRRLGRTNLRYIAEDMQPSSMARPFGYFLIMVLIVFAWVFPNNDSHSIVMCQVQGPNERTSTYIPV